MNRIFAIVFGLVVVELLACKHQQTTSASQKSLEEDDRDCRAVALESHLQNLRKLGDAVPDAGSDDDDDDSSKIRRVDHETSSDAVDTEAAGLSLTNPRFKMCGLENSPPNVLQAFIATADTRLSRGGQLIGTFAKDDVGVLDPLMGPWTMRDGEIKPAVSNIFAYDVTQESSNYRYVSPCQSGYGTITGCRNELYNAIVGERVTVTGETYLSDRPLVIVTLSPKLDPIYVVAFSNSRSALKHKKFCTLRLVKQNGLLIIDQKRANKCLPKYMPSDSMFPLPDPLNQSGLTLINVLNFKKPEPLF